MKVLDIIKVIFYNANAMKKITNKIKKTEKTKLKTKKHNKNYPKTASTLSKLVSKRKMIVGYWFK